MSREYRYTLLGVPIPTALGHLLEDLDGLPRRDLWFVLVVGVTVGLAVALTAVILGVYVLYG